MLIMPPRPMAIFHTGPCTFSSAIKWPTRSLRMASTWPSTEDCWMGRGLTAPASAAGRSSVTCSFMISPPGISLSDGIRCLVEPDFHAAKISARHAGTLESIVHTGVIGIGIGRYARGSHAGGIAEQTEGRIAFVEQILHIGKQLDLTV